MWFFRSNESEILYCQLAHGSPIGVIDGFTSIAELYKKIANCYDIKVSDILYCTANTHKIEIDRLILQVPQEPAKGFIFAHRKGRTKIVEITKSKNVLGASLTSNGTGYCIISGIEPGSVLHATPQVRIGDFIEEINEINVVGKSVNNVIYILKAFQAGSTFTMKLIEPRKAEY